VWVVWTRWYLLLWQRQSRHTKGMELVSIMERWTVCAKSVVTLICMGTPACIVCDTVMDKRCVHHNARSI